LVGFGWPSNRVSAPRCAIRRPVLRRPRGRIGGTGDGYDAVVGDDAAPDTPGTTSGEEHGRPGTAGSHADVPRDDKRAGDPPDGNVDAQLTADDH
jgi:hypothetical protein